MAELTDLKCATRSDLAAHAQQLLTEARNKPLTASGSLALKRWQAMKRSERVKTVFMFGFALKALKRAVCFFGGHVKGQHVSHYNCERCDAVIYRDHLRPSCH